MIQTAIRSIQIAANLHCFDIFFLNSDQDRLTLMMEVAGTKVYDDRKEDSLKMLGKFANTIFNSAITFASRNIYNISVIVFF